MYKLGLKWIIIILGVLFLFTCDDATESKNEPPVISSITADPSSIGLGSTSIVTCIASDADGDALSYSWSTTDGSINGNGATVTYTAPSTEGICTITCTVTDGNGGEDSETVNIGTVTDIDGNVYQTVVIGNQEWMAEHLKVTHYRNGDAIPNVTSDSDWYVLSTGAFSEYDNDMNNVATFGRLYNWYAVDDSRNIAPEGWHVPTDSEWQTLIDYLGGSSVAGGKMKETGTTHWSSPNTGATNESSFSALPGGSRDSFGSFYSMGDNARFWSSTEDSSYYAWGRSLYYGHSDVVSYNYHKKHGFLVRCVRD